MPMPCTGQEETARYLVEEKCAGHRHIESRTIRATDHFPNYQDFPQIFPQFFYLTEKKVSPIRNGEAIAVGGFLLGLVTGWAELYKGPRGKIINVWERPFWKKPILQRTIKSGTKRIRLWM